MISKLKSIIQNGLLNWFGKEKNKKEQQNNNCYKGLFWDLETRKFLKWNEHKQECKSTESSDR